MINVLTGGSQTVSGERISPKTALGVSAYFGGIRAISEDIAKIPCPVYRRLTPRGKEKLPKHPVHRILNVAPNLEMSPMTWRSTMLSHAMNWGGGFSLIERWEDGRGTPRYCWPLSPENVTLWRLDDGNIGYRLITPTGNMQWYEPWEIYHLHGLGFDGLTGYSIAQFAKQSLGLATAQEKSGAALFGRGSRPGGIVKTPVKLGKEAGEQFRENWEEMYSGANRDWTTAILPPGYDYMPITQPNKDAQWIESRLFSVQEVARWLRMPPHLLGDLSKGTFGNIADERISYVENTLTTWMAYAEQEAMRKLLLPSEVDTHLVEHMVNGLLRGNTEGRFSAYATGRQWGWLSVDDIRERENENPLPDGQGDVYLIPANMIPADQVGQASPDNDVPTDEDIDDARAGFRREFRRHLHRSAA